jgi:hypothetical protein
MGENVTQSDLDSECLPETGQELNGQQRMSAQFKEMIAPPDLFKAQQLLPDL